jgi:predicted phage terminase large subunit-like protein
MSRKHFYAQYLNKVIVTEEQILPFDKIRFLHASSIEQRNDSPRVWIKGDDGEFVEVTLRMCIDPAATCNKDSDFTACVVGGKDEHGNLYVLDLKVWKLPVDKWVREMYSLLDKWHLKGIHLETVGWFVTMKDSIKKYFGEYYPISIRDYKPTSKTSKKERIEAGLEPLMTNGMLYMTSWCMTSQEVQDQFNFFPAETVHDDAPDVVQQLNEVSIKTVPLKKQQESNKVIKYNTRYGGVY